MWWNVFTIASNSYKHDIAPIILLHKIIALSTSTVNLHCPVASMHCMLCGVYVCQSVCACVSFYLHSPHGLTIKATRACVWFHLIGKCLLQMNVGLCIVKMIKAACECANQISTWTINWCNLWTKAANRRRSDFQCSGNLHSHLLNTIKSSSERIREYGIHKWNYLTSCSLHLIHCINVGQAYYLLQSLLFGIEIKLFCCMLSTPPIPLFKFHLLFFSFIHRYWRMLWWTLRTWWHLHRPDRRFPMWMSAGVDRRFMPNR